MPFAARFDGVEALALRFVSRGGVGDAGFRVRYLADGACFNDCGGRGACEAALRACDPGWAGADCSIPLPTLPANGSALDGVVAPGETKYFRVRVDGDEAPSDPRALVIELTIPPGADGRNGVGAKPLLTVANATGGGDEREREEEEEEEEESDGGGGGKKSFGSTSTARARATRPRGAAGSRRRRTRYRTRTDLRTGPCSNSASARLAGPVSAYRLGGTPLFVPPAAGGARFARSPYAVVPSLPTPTYHAGSAYRAWEARAPVHRLTIANASLARGSYVVAVTNTGEIPLPSFLAGVADLRGEGGGGARAPGSPPRRAR